MFRIVLWAGMLGVLMAAGATTLAFRVTEPEVAPPQAAADPLADHLKHMQKEMTLP